MLSWKVSKDSLTKVKKSFVIMKPHIVKKLLSFFLPKANCLLFFRMYLSNLVFHLLILKQILPFWDLSKTCQIFSWIWKVQPLKSTHGTTLCPIEFLRHSFHSPFKLFWPPSNVVPQDPGNNCVPWMGTPWNFPQNNSLCSCLLVFSCFSEGKKQTALRTDITRTF